jgi:GntR family transcriptional regulator / MocR family aminotransferase
MNRTHAARSSRRSIPVYREVYQRIRSEILSGRLAAGARLPSSRTLAAELGIARGTVVTAFQMLAGEGYTSSAGARGTVVNVALPRVRKLRPTAEFVETGEHHRTVRTPPTPLLFQVGLPALDVFPRKLWTQIMVRVARQLDHEQMVNPNLHCGMGYEPLRLAIASYLRIARDITCSADQILITAGFQGALGLASRFGLRIPDMSPRAICCSRPNLDSWASESMMAGSTLLRRFAARPTPGSHS